MKLPYHCSSFWLIAGIGMERFAPKREPKRAGPLTQNPLYETRGLRRFRLQVSLGKDLLTLAGDHVANGGICPRTLCTNSCLNERWSEHSWITGV
jgi:hypothetical protein